MEITIKTDALLHKTCGGEIIFITIGNYNHSICTWCGKQTSKEKLTKNEN